MKLNIPAKRKGAAPAFAPMLLALLTTAFLPLLGGTAHASGAVTGYGQGGAVVTVYTGAKNYSNHTQYVGTIYITDASSNSYCDPGDPVEAWAGNVYYGRDNGCGAHSFYINRWVPSGSGVCGSFYRYYNLGHQYPWEHDNIQHLRAVACIGISV